MNAVEDNSLLNYMAARIELCEFLLELEPHDVDVKKELDKLKELEKDLMEDTQ